MKETFSQPVIAGALVLSLIGGVVAFAQLNVSAATSASTISSESKSLNQAKSIAIQFSDSLLALLKLDRTILKSKLDSGLSLSEIATQQNVTRDALKVEITKQADQILVNKKTEFISKIDDIIDSKNLSKIIQPKNQKNKPVGNHRMFVNELDLTTIAILLGFADQKALNSAIDSGSSLADLATIKKVNIQRVKEEITKLILAQLDKKYKAGNISAEKLKEEMSNLPSHVDNLVNKKPHVKGKK